MKIKWIEALTGRREKQSPKDVPAAQGSGSLPIAPSGAGTSPGYKLFNGVRILLVEDSELLRVISTDVLENEGAIVTQAEDGRKAVDAVANGGEFDLIIMDLVMPVLDGISATKIIVEAQKDLPEKTPILGLTGDGTAEQINAVIRAGAYACLSKPLNPTEMAKTFRAYKQDQLQ